jgi:protein-tyrosine phosphatase
MELLRGARRLLVRLRDRVHEALHPGRRRRALRRLERRRPGAVLFVCLGNVCRSPYAERVLQRGTGGTATVESAGFIKPGRTPPDTALLVAGERGIQHGDHRSRVVTREMLERADAVFFFDRFNRADLLRTPGVSRDRLYWLGDLDPTWEGRRAILDPWGKDEAEFHRVFARIERCVSVLERVVREDGAWLPGD